MLANTLSLITSYLVGSFSPGALIVRYAQNLDITLVGSRSSGATNVARVLGKKYFFLIFGLDFFKALGYLAFLHFFLFSYTVQFFAAILLIVGNSYSCFLGFKGGKGVATSVGIIVWFLPQVAMILSCVWGLSFLMTHTVGISSVIACSFLFFMIMFNQLPVDSIFLMLFISLWGIMRHAENINLFFSDKKRNA